MCQGAIDSDPNVGRRRSSVRLSAREDRHSIRHHSVCIAIREARIVDGIQREEIVQEILFFVLGPKECMSLVEVPAGGSWMAELDGSFALIQ